jgi:hypothetical protein
MSLEKTRGQYTTAAATRPQLWYLAIGALLLTMQVAVRMLSANRSSPPAGAFFSG